MPTTREIAANQRRKHTPEGLRRLRRAARTNRPWLKSTGPRTETGKRRSRMNALKHGERSAAVIEHRRALNEVLRAVRDLTPGLTG